MYGIGYGVLRISTMEVQSLGGVNAAIERLRALWRACEAEELP